MARNQILTGRRAFLFGLGTLAGMSAFTAAGKLKHSNNQLSQGTGSVQRNNFAVAGDVPLRDRAAAKGLFYGTQARYSELFSNPKLAALITRECSILVPGNQLKWPALRPSPDRFDFTRADRMVEFAQTHNMLVHGHALVWGEVPQWFKDTVTSKDASQVMQKHIATVVGHYAGKIHSWDVVNEPIEPTNKKTGGLKDNIWFKLLGPDYIETAFRAAAEADPQALLVLNDNGLDHDTSHADKKRAAMLKLLERLRSTGVPVQALGLQAHLFRKSDENRFDPTKLRSFLSDVAGLGLKILITEMDVSDQYLPLDTNVRDRTVAQAYQDYLSIVLEEPAVISVTTWGLSDRYTWISKQRPREDGAPVRPLPFDAELRPKLAYAAIARALEEAPVRNAQIRLPEQTAFGDVQGHWAQAHIQALAAKNIISGFPDGTFRPNAPVTRAEFAAIVAKAFTSTQRNKSTTAFLDIPQNFWAYNAIQTAAKSGFVAGYPDGAFQPSQQIPRVQVLVSLASGLNLGTSDPNVLSFYQDAAEIPAYATSKVAAATQRKIVMNYPMVNQLNPNQDATRAEVAAFVHQALVGAGKAEPINSPYVVQVTSPS